MAQKETYGNWLGPKRLQRQPGIYSVPGKVTPMSDLRSASPDSFEDDYDDVSVAGSERGPPPKGVYLLAGAPGSSRSPSLKDSEAAERNSRDLGGNSRDFGGNSVGNSRDLFGNPRNSRNSRNSRCSRCSRCSALLALLLALNALGWAALLAAAAGKYQELRAELEELKSNFSGIQDSVRQEHTRLRFGIHQHQLELQGLAELLCQSRGSSRQCEPGWKLHGSSCFSFSRDSLSWGLARNACADLGAHLAVVSSDEEQMFLTEQRESSHRYWLGVTDQEQEGKWIWVTEEQPNLGFWDTWAQDPEKEQKDCGVLGLRGRWENERCSERLRWICEKPGHC